MDEAAAYSNNRFQQYYNMFENLTMQNHFQTDSESVISILLTHDGQFVLGLLKVDDELLRIVIYENLQNEMVNEIKLKGEYVRAN